MKTYTDPITNQPVEPATEPAVELPLEAPKPLKLSEAMRLGSIATTQARGAWDHEDPASENGKAMCAMSTAWYALTGDSDAHGTPLTDLLSNAIVVNPVTGQNEDLCDTIMELNDSHGWDRSRIADWLESLGL